MTAVVVISTQERPGATARISHLRALRLRLPLFRHAGHWSPNLCDLVASIESRVRDRSGAGARNHGRSVPLKFARAIQAARRLSPRLFIRSALQAGKQTAGCVSKALHLTLSAGLPGLAASVGRTPTSQKENRKCPTMQWRNPT